MSCHLCSQSSHRGVGVARHYNLVVYFIGNDENPVPDAEPAHALHFLPGPYAAGRVVGIAQDEGSHFRVGKSVLQIVPVYSVGAIGIDERTCLHLAPLISDGGEETIIDGGGHQHFVARQANRPDDC